MPIVRFVRPQDTEAVLEIYKHYIIDSPITFETEIPPLNHFRQRIDEITAKYPWLVYETKGEIFGYAYASAFKSRAAYEWSVEATVYVKNGCQRLGIGKSLYSELLEILRVQGAVNVIAGITLPNEGSVALHQNFGFKHVATFKDAGYKAGTWWDVGYWQLQFPKPADPKPLLKVSAVTEEGRDA